MAAAQQRIQQLSSGDGATSTSAGVIDTRTLGEPTSCTGQTAEWTNSRSSERRFGTSCPPLISRNSTTAGALRSGWEVGSKRYIIGLETGAVLARTVRRKVEDKRWNERALKMVTGILCNPRPGEVVVRYGPTADCGGCFRKSQQDSERCRARFELLFAREDRPLEVRAQEGQPAPPDPLERKTEKKETKNKNHTEKKNKK